MQAAFKSLKERGEEWLTASVMISWGLTFSLPGDLLGEPAFVAFHRFGTTDAFWAFTFTSVGIARIVSLYINGRWPRGPYIRIIGAVIGALSWAQIAWLFLEASRLNGTPMGTGPAVYGLLAAFEVLSIHKAAFDARYHHS